MENTALPPPLAAPAVSRDDFADWLSPMLVKELRQGVRTRVFVFLFILLQVFMLMDLSLSLIVAASGTDTSEGTAFFWSMVGLPVLLILPFSGLNAIGGEIRGNTLELIFLTRLTAFRIVLGKWFALFSQALLLVCAVLPYLVLRYFMGGVNIANEVMLLAMMLIGSALLTALAVGFSAFPARLIRPLVAVGGIIMLFAGGNLFSIFIIRRGGFSMLPGPAEIITILLCSAILLVLMLDTGAARIAPPAENHPAAMRALAVVGLLTAVATQAISKQFIGVSFIAFVVAVIVCGVAACEQPRAIPSLYRPFARWGVFGRIVGRFFYPGWHTGTLFTLGMFAAFGVLFVHEKVLERDQTFERFVALLGTLLLPVALGKTVFARWNRPTALFFLVQTASLVVLVFSLVCDNVLNTKLKDIVSVLPLCALLGPYSYYPGRFGLWEFPALYTTGLCAVVSLGASVPAFKITRLLERDSLALPAPPKNPSPKTSPVPSAPPDAPLA